MSSITQMVEVEVDVAEVLLELNDEDLIHELGRRGVTAIKASDSLLRLTDEVAAAYRERDSMHFEILLDRIRALAI